MENFEETMRTQKINDVRAIHFTEDLNETLTAMGIILTLYQIDEDPEIVHVCKEKLLEGIEILKKQGNENKATEFYPEK